MDCRRTMITGAPGGHVEGLRRTRGGATGTQPGSPQPSERQRTREPPRPSGSGNPTCWWRRRHMDQLSQWASPGLARWLDEHGGEHAADFVTDQCALITRSQTAGAFGHGQDGEESAGEHDPGDPPVPGGPARWTWCSSSPVSPLLAWSRWPPRSADACQLARLLSGANSYADCLHGQGKPKSIL